MKKRYNLSDVDCANCAAKMEEQISIYQLHGTETYIRRR